MATLVGDALPDDLLERLSGRALASCTDKVIPIFTVDLEGWPHPALLSYFEVVAKDRRNIRLATYTGSNTTNNMRRNGKLTLVILDARVAYYIKGEAQELRPQMQCAPHNAKLNLVVEQVLTDQTDEQYEPGAYLSGGVTYYNPNRAAQQKQAEDLLRELLE
jgi:hypothetical protein